MLVDQGTNCHSHPALSCLNYKLQTYFYLFSVQVVKHIFYGSKWVIFSRFQNFCMLSRLVTTIFIASVAQLLGVSFGCNTSIQINHEFLHILSTGKLIDTQIICLHTLN